MATSLVCPHCRSSTEATSGPCPACGGTTRGAGPGDEPGQEPEPDGLASGEAREFGGEPSDAGVRLDDGSTACPVAFGPYRVAELIGKGGMGLVFRAVHEVNREVVAVKTVRVRKRGMLHRIRREIHALARTRHPGLVRIIETGQSEGLPWYAMELLEGQSLHDRMLEGRRRVAQGDEPAPARSSGWGTRPDFVLVSGPEDESEYDRVAGKTATVGYEPRPRRSQVETVEGRAADCPTMEVTASPPPQVPDATPTPEKARVASPAAERAPPEPIPDGELRDFLILIARLCETLAYLHGEGIVHRDIKPQNIIIRPDGRPVLLDFGLASYFGAGGRESLEVGGKVEGTPEYMSPEQIRGEYVDARADLYALGCILYEGVTGRVPFRGRTPGGTLRAHLKVPAARPRSIKPDIPEELDALLMHLLAKRAGDRLGYARDIIAVLDRLGCAGPGWGAGAVPRDYLYRPSFVGRDSTLAKLEKQVRKALSRPGRCIFLRGQNGVGKTRFIMELARHLEQGGLTVATGECLPIVANDAPDEGPAVRATALHPFRPFLQMVVDCCLEKGCEEVARLLGPGGGVLATCEPSLSDLPGAPGDDPDPAEDGGEGSLASRLIEALGETLAEFGRTSPVVLFLDDLEWADALTLHFLALFHVGVWDAPNVAIVAAFRTEGDDSAIRDYLPVFRDATFVDIGPLEPGSLGEIVRDMLGSHEVDDRFVDHLARRAGGNPFFVAEFLRAAVAEGVLRRDHSGCWRAGLGRDGAGIALDEETFDAAVGLPESLHDLIVRRLSNLSEIARRLLELAAVVGREVDADLLESVEPIGEPALAAVESLLVAQVLEEARDGHFRFAHDKLREVAYEQIPPDRRRALHRSVALAIEAGLDDPEDRSRQSATLAHHWYRSIGDRSADPEAVARAIEHLEASTRQAVNAGLPAEAVEFGRAAARLLGVELPESPAAVDHALRAELRAIDEAMGARHPSELLDLPPCTDPEVDRVVALLLEVQPPAYLSDQLGLFALMASKNLAKTLECGLGPRSASAFAMAALVRRIILDDPRTALAFADLAVELDRRREGSRTAEVLFLRSWFVAHWVQPTRQVLADLDRAAAAGQSTGDTLYACYSHAGFLTLLAASGEPLGRVILEAEARIERVGHRAIVARFHCVLERQLARALAGLTSGPTSLSDGTFDESRDLAFICRTTNANQVGHYHVARLKLLYYRGEHRRAIEAAGEALTVAGSYACQPAEVDLVFFRALALIASGASDELGLAREHLAKLQAWRVDCEANFGHKALLVEAELARAEGLDRDASRYVEAARVAEEAGFLQHAALARELAARHLARLGDDPRPMLRAAVAGYRAWGADALADRLDAEG